MIREEILKEMGCKEGADGWYWEGEHDGVKLGVTFFADAPLGLLTKAIATEGFIKGRVYERNAGAMRRRSEALQEKSIGEQANDAINESYRK